MSTTSTSGYAGGLGPHHLNYVNALGKRLRTEGGKWPCAVMPALSKRLRDIVLALYRQVDRSKEAVQASTPLSALAKPPDYLFTPRGRRLWMQGVVSVALVDARTGLSLLAGMDPDTPGELLDLLARMGVPHLVLRESLAPADQARELLEYARERPANLYQQKTSTSQRLIASHLRDALWLLPPEQSREVADTDPGFTSSLRRKVMNTMDADHWMLLEEVSLQRLVSFPACTDKSVGEFLRRSSVDAVLVHSRNDDCGWPLLAVEFDGPHHEELGQGITDSLKNALLEDAGIPLLRVSRLEVAIRRWSRASSDEREEMSRYLDPMKHLVRSLAHEEGSKVRFELDSVKGRLEILRMRDEMSSAIYGKRFDSLSFFDREMLSLQEPLASMDLELAAIQHHREVNQEEMFGYWTLAGAMKDMKVDISDFHDFEFTEGDLNTWSATATYVGKNGVQAHLVAPPVSLNFPNVQRDRIEQMVHRYLAESIALLAAEFS